MKRENLLSGKRAALYIRKSKEETGTGYSIASQRESLEEYANTNGMYIVDHYVDDGRTARKEIHKRKDFQRLLEDVRAGLIDYVLFIRLDRWTRNVGDYYKVQEVLDAHKVNWKAILEDFDTFTTNGRLNLNIKLTIDQDEADRTGERIRSVNESRLKNKMPISGTVPIGYKIVNKRWVIDPDTAHIVQDAFRHYSVSHSLQATLQYLKDEHNYDVYYSTLSRMVRRADYIGLHRGIEGFCDPLVDVDLFNKVQEIREKNIAARTGNKYVNDYIFAGLLQCNVCGGALYGNRSRANYLSYRCGNHYKEKKCSNSRVISEKKLEKYLLLNIENEISNFIADFEADTPAPRNKKKVDKVAIEKKLDKLKNLYLNDLIDLEEYRKDREEFLKILADADKKDVVVKRRTDLKKLKSFLANDFSKIYENLNPHEKRHLWRSIVRKIVINLDTGHHDIFFV